MTGYSLRNLESSTVPPLFLLPVPVLNPQWEWILQSEICMYYRPLGSRNFMLLLCSARCPFLTLFQAPPESFHSSVLTGSSFPPGPGSPVSSREDGGHTTSPQGAHKIPCPQNPFLTPCCTSSLGGIPCSPHPIREQEKEAGLGLSSMPQGHLEPQRMLRRSMDMLSCTPVDYKTFSLLQYNHPHPHLPEPSTAISLF